MLKKAIATMQIGKQGLTENFYLTLENAFKNRQNVKINVLKNAGHDKDNVREMSNKILEKLGKKYTAKVLGFTIFLKKWRKEVR